MYYGALQYSVYWPLDKDKFWEFCICWEQSLARLTASVDTDNNPYRVYILPLILKDPALGMAMVALSSHPVSASADSFGAYRLSAYARREAMAMILVHLESMNEHDQVWGETSFIGALAAPVLLSWHAKTVLDLEWGVLPESSEGPDSRSRVGNAGLERGFSNFSEVSLLIATSSCTGLRSSCPICKTSFFLMWKTSLSCS
jgi:hypothetical protein